MTKGIFTLSIHNSCAFLKPKYFFRAFPSRPVQPHVSPHQSSNPGTPSQPPLHPVTRPTHLVTLVILRLLRQALCNNNGFEQVYAESYNQNIDLIHFGKNVNLIRYLSQNISLIFFLDKIVGGKYFMRWDVWEGVKKKQHELGLLAQPKVGRCPEGVQVPNPLNRFAFIALYLSKQSKT